MQSMLFLLSVRLSYSAASRSASMKDARRFQCVSVATVFSLKGQIWRSGARLQSGCYLSSRCSYHKGHDFSLCSSSRCAWDF